MEYKIIHGSIPKFEEDVNTAIKRNWQPIGGVSSSSIGFVQAMTRTCKPSKTVKKSGLQPKAENELPTMYLNRFFNWLVEKIDTDATRHVENRVGHG